MSNGMRTIIIRLNLHKHFFQRAKGSGNNKKMMCFLEFLIFFHIQRNYFIINNCSIRVIPQGTVDNNLGPDRLVGPKALDPNYCRQPTL